MSLMLASDVRPSYAAGFARSAGESANPGLWQGLGLSWAPALGSTGQALPELSGHRGLSGTLQSAASWGVGGVRTGPESAANSHVVIGKPTFLDGLTQFTVVCYAKPFVGPGSWANEDTLVSNWRGAGRYLVNLRLDSASSGNLDADFNTDAGNGGDTIVIGDISNEWHTFGLTWDGATVTALFDNIVGSGGALGGTAQVAMQNDLWLGNSPHLGSTDQFDGIIGTVSIWDRALNRNEIAKLAADPLALFRLRRRITYSVPAAVAGNPWYQYHQQTAGAA